MKRLDVEKHKDNYIKMGAERGAPGPGRSKQNGGRGHAAEGRTSGLKDGLSKGK